MSQQTHSPVSFLPNELDETPSAVYHIPIPRNKSFVGRKAILEALSGTLKGSPGIHQIALVGVGGSGKTQIALQFAYWVKDNMPGHSVFWIWASSSDKYESSCDGILDELGIPHQQGSSARTLMHYLRADTYRPWLFIVDDGDDADLPTPFNYPRPLLQSNPNYSTGQGCMVLWTTRSQQVAGQPDNRLIQLPPMTIEDSEAVLKNALSEKQQLQNKQDVRDLLALTANLPLAITSVAAHLNHTQKSVSEFLTEYKTSSKEYRYTQGTVSLRNPVKTIQDLTSFDRIIDLDLDRGSLTRLLLVLSCLHWDYIPLSMLPRTGVDDPPRVGVYRLLAQSILVVDGTNDSVSVHRLVHHSLQRWVKAKNKEEEAIKIATEHLANIFPEDNWEHRTLWRSYLPHALSVLDRGSHTEAKNDLLIKAGRCLLKDGRLVEAMDCLEVAHSWAELRYLDTSESLLEPWLALARVKQANGDIKDSVRLLEKTMMWCVKVFPQGSPYILRAQKELGTAYLELGQKERAIDTLEHVVAIQRYNLSLLNATDDSRSRDHMEFLMSQQELGRAYREDGQTILAISLLESVVERRKMAPQTDDHTTRNATQNQHGKDHTDVLMAQHELAQAYLAIGETGKAHRLSAQVADTVGQNFAYNHPFWVHSQYLLARTFQALGDHGTAVVSMSLLVNIIEAQMEQGLLRHPEFLEPFRTLGQIYKEIGYKIEASHLNEKVSRLRSVRPVEYKRYRRQFEESTLQSLKPSENVDDGPGDQDTVLTFASQLRKLVSKQRSKNSQAEQQKLEALACELEFAEPRYITVEAPSLPSVIDKAKLVFEAYTGGEWDWRPWPQPLRPLRYGEVRINWKCVSIAPPRSVPGKYVT